MSLITPELVNAIDADRYRKADEQRLAKALKATQQPKLRQARGPWRFRQVLRRIVPLPVKR